MCGCVLGGGGGEHFSKPSSQETLLILAPNPEIRHSHLHGIRSPPPPPDVPRGDVTVVGGHSTALHAHAAWRKRGQRGPSAPREGDEMLEVSVDGKLHWEARVEEEAGVCVCVCVHVRATVCV